MKLLVHKIIKIVFNGIQLEKEEIVLLRVVWGNLKIDIKFSGQLVYDFKTCKRLR